MRNAVKLNRLLLKFLLLSQVDVQENSSEENIKLNFLGINWESKRFWGANFQAFRKPKIQNSRKHGATSRIYYVYYKPPILYF